MQHPALHRAGAGDSAPAAGRRQPWLALTAAACALALLTALVDVLQQAVETGKSRQAMFTSQMAYSDSESN